MNQRKLEAYRKHSGADQPRRLRQWAATELEAYEYETGHDKTVRLYRGTMLEWAADELDRREARIAELEECFNTPHSPALGEGGDDDQG